MKIHWGTCSVLAAILGIGAVMVGPAQGASSLALPLSDPAEINVTARFGGGSTASTGPFVKPSAPVYESVRFRPRRGRYHTAPPRPETFTQIHGGFMSPIGSQDPGFVLGLRAGVFADRNVQVGGQIDWVHRSNSATVIVGQGPGPAGTIITTEAELARSSSDLVPFLGYIQLSASDLRVVPYLGFGAGYELLHLAAHDFRTNDEFKGTFGGFGWQAWGGFVFPVSGHTRLNAEVFFNGSEVARDIGDPVTGVIYRETVDQDGLGMRFGLAWGF